MKSMIPADVTSAYKFSVAVAATKLRSIILRRTYASIRHTSSSRAAHLSSASSISVSPTEVMRPNASELMKAAIRVIVANC